MTLALTILMWLVSCGGILAFLWFIFWAPRAQREFKFNENYARFRRSLRAWREISRYPHP